MEKEVYFSIKRPDVVHETIDGETIIVNLESGTYYSLRFSGVDIWNLIESGVTFEQTAKYIKALYNGEEELIEKEIRDLMVIFQKEDLVKISSEKPSSSEVPNPSINEGKDKEEFAKPVFEKYTDMQQLLLLDPVHEVSEEGWPHELDENLDGNE